MSRMEKSGSGVFSTDMYRDRKIFEAIEALSGGYSVLCRSGDHSGSELCIETISRLKNDLKKVTSDAKLNVSVLAAVENLKQGYGSKAVAGTHSGGNTCAEVIAQSTT